MSIPTTDAMYNSNSREVQMRYDIYFKPGSPPLEVTMDNYLVSSTGLDESQSDTDSELGTVSSNEITLELLNDSKIFTPTNVDSPYYGYIKKDVQINVFGRVLTDEDETTWDPLGTYYVKEWQTSSSGLLAYVTANDALYAVFDAPMPTYPITKNVPIKDFYRQYFELMHVEATVDGSLLEELPYAFINADNKSFITDLTNGALAMCFCNNSGGVTVLNRLTSRPLRATLTDSDQIIDVLTKQSITQGHDGVSVICHTPYEGSVAELVTLNDQAVPVGISTISAIGLVTSPLIRVSYATVKDSHSVRVKKVQSTQTQCELTIENTGNEAAIANISLHGVALEHTSITSADGGTDLLDLDSLYVQTNEQAELCKRYLKRIVDTKAATLTVKVRGNFKLHIGDKVRVQSTQYKTDFTGIIIRSEYSYTGGLSGTLTLVAASLFGEV